MYIKEVVEEMERRHRLSLKAQQLTISLLDKYFAGRRAQERSPCTTVTLFFDQIS
jgi:hypothetical protein